MHCLRGTLVHAKEHPKIHEYTNAYMHTYLQTGGLYRCVQGTHKQTKGVVHGEGISSTACYVLLQATQLPHFFLLLLTHAHNFSSRYTNEDSSPAIGQPSES